MNSMPVSRSGLLRPERVKFIAHHKSIHRCSYRTVAPCAVPWWQQVASNLTQEAEKAVEIPPDAAKDAALPAAVQEQMTAEIEVLGKNRFVIEKLSKLLPMHRDRVTPEMLQQLGSITGFSPMELFRKFMWFVLKDRTFDEAAVGDLVHVATEMGLSNGEVAEALLERCQRIERKFGNLMLPPEGVSEKVLQEKATCRTFFSKMLYLSECEELLKENDKLSRSTVRRIFGATEDDIEQLKIASLKEVDLEPKQKKWLGFGSRSSV